jgi:iron complex transport system substrate-binding protein
VAKVGDTMTPNMETIIALKPDLVVVSTESQIEAFTKTLEENHIAVYVMAPESIEDVLFSLKNLSSVVGGIERVNGLVDGLEKRVHAVEDKAGPGSSPKVFVQISKEPLFTVGKGSFLNQIIVQAGGHSVTATVESPYPKLSKETALALQPDVIILSESDDNQAPNDVFKNSPAVKNGRVYKINADLLSRPGPRLVDALEQIARDLHPEKFK